ncbi:hypothetical protein D3C85_1038980 [compost metagenome]
MGIGVGKLKAGHQAVFDETGVEPGTQVGLVDPAFGGRVAVFGRTIDLAIGDVALAVVRVGNDVIQRGARHTETVGQGQVIVQVVFDSDGATVVGGLAVVASVQAVEVVTVNMCGFVDIVFATVRAASQRNAVVRHVIGVQVVVANRYAGIGAQAKGKGRRHAPTADINIVAAGDVGFMFHQVQAERRCVGQLLVQVQGCALGLVRTPSETTIVSVTQPGGFAHQVEATTCGACSGKG